MKTRQRFLDSRFSACPALLGIFAALFSMTAANAASISTWNVARDSIAVSVNSGMNTASPTFGNGTASNVDDAFFTGEFGETVSLAVGQTLTVTYGITFTGGTDSTNQYRFVVGDYGATADQSWTGGWNFVTGDALYQANTSGNVQSTSANAVNLSATNVTTGTFSGNSATAYTFTMSITRDSATTVDLVGSLVGGSGSLSQTFTKLDQTTGLFNYNGVGLLFGGSADLDQAAISNASYSVVPEPSSAAMLVLLPGLLLFRRRRS